jgi:hypothetical protein
MIIKLKEIKCFGKVNKTPEVEDYSIIYVPSGFKGVWIRVVELYDGTVDVYYASSAENEAIDEWIMKGDKKGDKL